MSERKRPNVFGEDEDLGPDSPNSKKLKTSSARAQPTFLPPSLPTAPSAYGHPPSATAAAGSNGAPLPPNIAAIQAQVKAKLAAMQAAAQGRAAPPATAPPPPPAPVLPPGMRPIGSTSTPTPPSGLDPELARKIAEARKKVEMMAQARAQPRHNPYLSGGQGYVPPSSVADDSSSAKGGIHPLLMQSSAAARSDDGASKKDRYKPMLPKFSTAKANVAAAPRPPPGRSATPQAAPTSEGTPGPESIEGSTFFDPKLMNGSAGASGKSHMGKGAPRPALRFNQKGKFVQLGEAMRAEARMEDLKKRILESAKKAGLESEMEDQAKVIKRPAPPDIEWWDIPFVPEKDYNSYTEDFLDKTDAITIYVQHPIQIPAPGDKVQVEPKPLFLTKKEQKKMRRQRRLAALQDKQDRIKMGLLPPDPPKVKLSNMMRVLTQNAVADPTKIEAQVRREMRARENAHLKANEDRKLTGDQRWEKKHDKMVKDESMGIHSLCFKVRWLSNPSHKFKVKKNAQDLGLTGVTVHNPRFCLVVVEGGQRAIKKYRQLMMNRIDWTEETRARPGDEERQPLASGSGAKSGQGQEDEPHSLADNTCVLVWKGEHKERVFGEYRNANCPSEASVKETLGSKLEGLWDVAKREVIEED